MEQSKAAKDRVRPSLRCLNIEEPYWGYLKELAKDSARSVSSFVKWMTIRIHKDQKEITDLAKIAQK